MIIAYLDNILIYTLRIKKIYKEETQKVLQLLKNYKINLNKEKSKYIRIEIIFLGTIISEERLKIELKKIKVVKE